MQLRYLVCLPHWSMHLQINGFVFRGPSAWHGRGVLIVACGMQEGRIEIRHERRG